MKLHDFAPAPNGQRVRVFMAEKGLEIPVVEVKVRDGAMFEEPYRSMNPFAVVPFLELDDGTCIGESVSICRYLEELHPTPSLMGRDPRERALVDMWNRRVELDGYLPVMHALRNAEPSFQGRVVPGTRNDLVQYPEIVERGRDMLMILLERLDERLSGNRFLAGETFSIADITGYFLIRLADRTGFPIPDDRPDVKRWHEDVAARPSVQSP